MIESFFGSGTPIWTGVPSPGFAWFPTPVGVGNRPPGVSPAFGAPPFLTPVPVPHGWGAGVQGTGGQGEVMGYGGFGVPGVVPALAGPEVANGPTARALLVAVAMRRGQPMGPTSDQEIEEFVYDALDMLGANDVELRIEAGRATLTGSVAHKRLKRDVGEIAWAMPGISDVQNNVTIVGRRRSRAGAREAESQPAPPSRKTA